MMFRTIKGRVVEDQKAMRGVGVGVRVVLDEVWAISADRDYVAGEEVELLICSPAVTRDAAVAYHEALKKLREALTQISAAEINARMGLISGTAEDKLRAAHHLAAAIRAQVAAVEGVGA